MNDNPIRPVIFLAIVLALAELLGWGLSDVLHEPVQAGVPATVVAIDGE